MAICTVKNVGDIPLCIHDPSTGEALSIFPGYTCKADSGWADVRSALIQARAQIIAVEPPVLKPKEPASGEEPIVIPEK